MKIFLYVTIMLLISCGGISKIDYHYQIKGTDINLTSLELEEDVIVFSKNKKSQAHFSKGVYYPYKVVNKSLYIWYISPKKVMYYDTSILNKLMLQGKSKEVTGGFMIKNGEIPEIVTVWFIDNHGNFSLKEDKNDLKKIKYKLLLN